MIFFYVIYYIGQKSRFLHSFFDILPVSLRLFASVLTRPPVLCYTKDIPTGRCIMKTRQSSQSSCNERQILFTLCRFLSARFLYRFMLLLLSGIGILLSILGRTQFAPYGICVVCLLLPSFLHDSLEKKQKKENSDSPLFYLYKQYRYSPVLFAEYRISLTICAVMLFIWYLLQPSALRLLGLSVPLLCTLLCLALYPLVSRILFFRLHHRMMNGIL